MGDSPDTHPPSGGGGDGSSFPPNGRTPSGERFGDQGTEECSSLCSNLVRVGVGVGIKQERTSIDDRRKNHYSVVQSYLLRFASAITSICACVLISFLFFST